MEKHIVQNIEFIRSNKISKETKKIVNELVDFNKLGFYTYDLSTIYNNHMV